MSLADCCVFMVKTKNLQVKIQIPSDRIVIEWEDYEKIRDLTFLTLRKGKKKFVQWGNQFLSPMPSPSAQTKHFLSSTKLKLLTTKILFMAKKANFAFNFIAKNRFHWFQQSLSFAYNLIAKKSISSITPENLIVKKISSWLNRSILHSIWLLQNQFHRFHLFLIIWLQKKKTISSIIPENLIVKNFLFMA